jgi:hypothetical protein
MSKDCRWNDFHCSNANNEIYTGKYVSSADSGVEGAQSAHTKISRSCFG